MPTVQSTNCSCLEKVSSQLCALEDAGATEEVALQEGRKKLSLRSVWPICVGTALQPGSTREPEGGTEGILQPCWVLLCQVTWIWRHEGGSGAAGVPAPVS